MNKSESNKKNTKKEPWLQRFWGAKYRAKIHNREFTLTKDQVHSLWISCLADRMEKPSLDRIDNDKGYTLDNCQFIPLRDNVIKDHYWKGAKHKQETKDKIRKALKEYHRRNPQPRACGLWITRKEIKENK